MRCRTCEAEIDDKALICYRCGAATNDPVRRPPAPPPARSPGLAPVALAVVFVGAAAFFGYRALSGAETPVAVWAMLAAAGVLLAIRLRLR